MANEKLRRQIAFEAARLLHFQKETEYHRAKQKAGRRLSQGFIKPGDLPSNREVREQIEMLARIHEGQRREENVRDMRVAALEMMRRLRQFRPRLTGTVLSGHAREETEIELHVFHDDAQLVRNELVEDGIPCRVEMQQDTGDREMATLAQLHVTGRHPFRISVDRPQKLERYQRLLRSGRSIEWATIRDVEEMLARDYPDLAVDAALTQPADSVDRFEVYRSLLTPLEQVKQSPKRHPEGDALYHSLQVFELACQGYPYDEEVLLAALLHDVGKAIDKQDHVTAGLEALDGSITPRTAWLIRHLEDGMAMSDGTLGARSQRRLEQAENFEELMFLAKCDREGRQRGAPAPDVDEALDYVRDLQETCDG